MIKMKIFAKSVMVIVNVININVKNAIIVFVLVVLKVGAKCPKNIKNNIL
jgi:hypothetical protein